MALGSIKIKSIKKKVINNIIIMVLKMEWSETKKKKKKKKQNPKHEYSSLPIKCAVLFLKKKWTTKTHW